MAPARSSHWCGAWPLTTRARSCSPSLRACARPSRTTTSLRVFADDSKNRARIDAIGSMPLVGLVDWHGDPFIHIALADYGDCSTYGILAVASDELVIIPRFSATGASMSRLLNHVMEKFGDAAIERRNGGS